MGRKQSALKTELLEAASSLFYLNGYANTGISEIIKKAGTNKTTFYQKYESKNDLGRKYILSFYRRILKTLLNFMKTSANVEDFLTKWFKFIKKNIQKNIEFNGCPVANYHGQLKFSETEEKEFIRRLSKRWLKVIALYLEKEKEKSNLQYSSKDMAVMFFSVYQGMLLSYKLTGDIKIVDSSLKLVLSMFKKS
ncbi:MAG: TetR/AcrR family transcriptional regulator [Spirochaetia bacterium]|nr:TetR/AcrR family transcriptional regulator [Spirochaetia bacterium]